MVLEIYITCKMVQNFKGIQISEAVLVASLCALCGFGGFM